jgi:chemotaxis signal transduction protein
MSVDWATVRERLRKSQQALDQTAAHDPRRVDAAFRERAARLAGPHPSAGRDAGGVPALVVRLGPQRCAVPLKELLEVIPRPRCARVPGSSARLAGVMNVRGGIRPVWDLARLLGLGGSQMEQGGDVLLVRRKREVGLLVERVEQIRLLRAQQWRQSGEGSAYILGITADAVMVLNIEALSGEELY